MDQLKPILAGLKKHYFWVVMVIVLISSLTFFYMSNSELNQEITSRKSAIEGSYGVVQGVSTKVSSHPNGDSKKEMDAIIKTHERDVQQAWETQYERQKKFLVWPKGVTDPSAIAKLDQKRPIELTVPNPLPEKDDPLVMSHREQYRDYIKKVFPEIAGVIGADWSASLDGTAVTTAVTNPVVKWDVASQNKLIKQIAPWYSPTKAPSTLDILYTQEDLWILSGLMNIIKSVNGDARENFQAAIKEIKWIRIGSTTNGAAGEVEEFKDTAKGPPGGGGGPYGGGGGGGSAPPSGGGGGVYGGASLGGAAAVSLDPANNRYVNSEFQPVSSSSLINSMKSHEPKDAFFAVAKRVPIQLRLNMDQRKVADLIAACGNNDLVVEIKQLRYGGEESKEGVHDTPAAGGAMGPAGGGGAPGGYGGNYSGGGPTGGGGAPSGYGGGYGAAAPGGYGSGADSNIKWNDKGYELDVELYGIVLLYNPVDIAQLGIEKVEQDTKLDTTLEASPAAPVEAPAAAVPADTTPAAADVAPNAGNVPPVVPTSPPPGTPPATTPDAAAPATPAPDTPTPSAPATNTPAAPASTESAARFPPTNTTASGN